ncbi:hypothetical protein FOZ61_003429, partial [Perkinsus olseni]
VKEDSVRAVRDIGERPPRRPKFSEKFPFVIYVSGPLVDDRDKFPKYIATVKPIDSLRAKNKRGKPYALLGFSTEEAGASALADLQADHGSGLTVRQFLTDPPKNGPGPRQNPDSLAGLGVQGISEEVQQSVRLADGALYQIRTIYKLPLQVYDEDAQLFIDTVVPLRLLVVPAAQPQ